MAGIMDKAFLLIDEIKESLIITTQIPKISKFWTTALYTFCMCNCVCTIRVYCFIIPLMEYTLIDWIMMLRWICYLVVCRENWWKYTKKKLLCCAKFMKYWVVHPNIWMMIQRKYDVDSFTNDVYTSQDMGTHWMQEIIKVTDN